MAYHPQVMELDDEGLSRAMVLISKHHLFDKLSLTPWEREFVKETPEWWARAGGLTWRQRRTARTILTKTWNELERRSDLGKWASWSAPSPDSATELLSQVKGVV